MNRVQGGATEETGGTQATGIQKAAVKPERQRTEEEPKGCRSLTEQEG